MSARRRPEGQGRAGQRLPPRSSREPGSGCGQHASPSGPCTAACARYRGLEAIAAATAGPRRGSPRLGPALSALGSPRGGPAPGRPPPAAALPAAALACGAPGPASFCVYVRAQATD